MHIIRDLSETPPNQETSFQDSDMQGYHKTIEGAYKSANQKLLKLLDDKCKVMDHLR